MMAFRLNWQSLKLLQQELAERGFKDDTPLIVIVVLKNDDARKSPVRFKNFLRFMWSLSETNAVEVKQVIIQDASGNTIFKQRKNRVVKEELPPEDGGHLIESWDALTAKEKSTLIEMTIAQINSYDR